VSLPLVSDAQKIADGGHIELLAGHSYSNGPCCLAVRDKADQIVSSQVSPATMTQKAVQSELYRASSNSTSGKSELHKICELRAQVSNDTTTRECYKNGRCDRRDDVQSLGQTCRHYESLYSLI